MCFYVSYMYYCFARRDISNPFIPSSGTIVRQLKVRSIRHIEGKTSAEQNLQWCPAFSIHAVPFLVEAITFDECIERTTLYQN